MSDRIDLNTARLREVATLPGVDHMMARRILLHRKLFGGFRNIEDVTEVEGMSPRILSVFADKVEVSPTVSYRPMDVLRFEAPRTPVVFAGPPHALRGTLVLRNEGETMLPVPALRLEVKHLNIAKGLPLTRMTIGIALLPGEEKRTFVKVRLDSTTPPGEYTGKLIAGDHTKSVTFIVTEHYATLPSPSLITLSTTAGKTNYKMLIHNGGNVPLTIGDLGGLILEDPDVQCRTIRETIAKVNHHPTFDQLVGTAADELKKNYASLPPVKVRTLNKPVVIQPGTDEVLDLSIQVPTGLPTHRDFVTRCRIFDTTISLHLMP